MRTLLLLSLTLSTALSNELDSLLDDYAKESDLSHQTKVEDTGSMQLVVYTRDELEKLQYSSLKDLLSLQRFFPYRESRFALPDIVKGEPLSVAKGGQYVKIYIDNHEISTLKYDTATHVLGNIELDFIDHVEIYQGPPSFEISIKPVLLVVKLYSKNPNRDIGNRVGTLTDNYGSFSNYFHIADNSDDINYFFYSSYGNIQRDTIENGATDLSRDEKNTHVFSSFEYGNHNLFFQYLNKKKDAFLTNSFDGTPTKDDLEFTMLNVGYNHSFEDDLDLKITFNKTEEEIDFMDDKPLLTSQHTSVDTTVGYLQTIVNIDSLNTLPATLPATIENQGAYGEKQKSKDSVVTIDLNKRFSVNKHNITTGIYGSRKKLDYLENSYVTSLGNVYINDSLTIPYDNLLSRSNNTNYLDKQTLYGLYFQDNFNYDEKTTLSLGVKTEKEQNSFYNDKLLNTYRLSHTYKNSNYTYMTYYTDMASNKSSYLFRNTNRDLKNESITIFGHETKYKEENLEVSFNIMDFALKDMILVNSQGELYNSFKDYDIIFNSLRVNYNLNSKDSLMIEPWRQDIDIKEEDRRFYAQGVFLKFINNFDRYTVLNELIWLKTNQYNIVDKYETQYNLGLTYRYSDDLTILIKGENLFDDRSGYQYHNYFNNSKGITSIDRKFSLGAEYTF